MHFLTQLPTATSNMQPVAAGAGNIIIDATVREPYTHPEHISPLGILCSFNGPSDYIINGRHFTIDDHKYVVLNKGGSVEIDIMPRKALNAFYIFFDHQIARSASQYFLRSPEYMLANEEEDIVHEIFAERLFDLRGTSLPGFIQQLKQSRKESLTEEPLYQLYFELALEHQHHRKEMDRLGTVKYATRQELYHRLYLAKFFIEEQYDQPLTLEIIGKTAMLNSFYLLRLFKKLFGQTPHQYLTGVRLQQAAMQLRDTSVTVQEVCNRVGFESLSSFSHLFRKKYGSSPASYRAPGSTACR